MLRKTARVRGVTARPSASGSKRKPWGAASGTSTRTAPGVLALTFFCAGFAGKLFAEEIEAIDMGPVEAMRATGANLFQVIVFGVFPQVRVAFTGIGIYTWDVAFRAATVVGFVGAGGMGWYLKRAVLQIQSERVAAIILSIVVLVLVSEVVSALARVRVMKMK